MPRIVRTDRACADAEEVAAYIAQNSQAAAERWLERLDRVLAFLASEPEMGERVDDLSPGVRRHCFGNYLVFYVPIDGGIELRRVLHGARRIEDLNQQ